MSGAKTAATAGSTYNSTAKGTNSQGDPDWALAFQAPPAASTAPAAAGHRAVTVPVYAGAAEVT